MRRISVICQRKHIIQSEKWLSLTQNHTETTSLNDFIVELKLPKLPLQAGPPSFHRSPIRTGEIFEVQYYTWDVASVPICLLLLFSFFIFKSFTIFRGYTKWCFNFFLFKNAASMLFLTNMFVYIIGTREKVY